jgi:hypothetical protein
MTQIAAVSREAVFIAASHNQTRLPGAPLLSAERKLILLPATLAHFPNS